MRGVTWQQVKLQASQLGIRELRSKGGSRSMVDASHLDATLYILPGQNVGIDAAETRGTGNKFQILSVVQ